MIAFWVFVLCVIGVALCFVLDSLDTHLMKTMIALERIAETLEKMNK
jgi:hypothetical protein